MEPNTQPAQKPQADTDAAASEVATKSPLPQIPSTDAKVDRLCRHLLLTCAGVGILLAGYLSFSELSGNLASRCFALLALLCCGAAGVLVLELRPVFKSREFTTGAVILLLLSLLLRLSLFDHISGDYVSFLSGWTETMRNMTVREALVTPIGDYNMPYLYVLLLISRLPFHDLYCIKLFSVAADVAAALAAAKLAALSAKKQTVMLAAFAAALLAPTTWLNSAYWGQCDSVYGALALWGLYAGLTKRPKAALLLFAFALSFKLQTIFVLPVCAFLLVSGRIRMKQLPLFPIGFLATMLPALLAGRTLRNTFSIYINQTEAYPYLSLNAPSFWSLISNDYYDELSGITVLLAMTVALLAMWLLLRKHHLLNNRSLLLIALLYSLMIPWLLPKMHERYFYLAEMLSIVWAAAKPRDFPVAVVLLSGGFFIYSVYLFGGMPILSMQYVAVIYGAVILYLANRCRQALYHKHPSVEQSNTI